MNVYKKFKAECDDEISAMGENKTLAKLTNEWMRSVNKLKYSYHFDFLGRPIIQYPQDMVVIQELIWKVKPDLIIETGIAHGGSLIMSASMLALLDICDAIENEIIFNPKDSKRKVLGVDIDIRSHNKEAIEVHPMSSRIQMIEGSSIDPSVVEQVKKISRDYKRVMVCLDSNHTHNHVLTELKAYAPLVSLESYCIVFDTIIEDMPESMLPDRPWGPADNPKTAAREYLKTHPEFEIDKSIDYKLLISVAPDGYLKRVK
jgi:cephalosporin hydroxylase